MKRIGSGEREQSHLDDQPIRLGRAIHLTLAKLAEEVARVWGAHGAHAQVLRWLITDSKRYRFLRQYVNVGPADSWSDHKAVRLDVTYPCDPPSIAAATDEEQFDRAVDDCIRNA
jgi:hypothetical protein